MATKQGGGNDSMPKYRATDRGVPVPEDVHKRRKEIREDYAQYVATEDIYYDGAVAYRVGDPVPASNVKRHGYDESGVVERAGEKKES